MVAEAEAGGAQLRHVNGIALDPVGARSAPAPLPSAALAAQHRLRPPLQQLRQQPQRARGVGELLKRALELVRQRPRPLEQPPRLRQGGAGLGGQVGGSAERRVEPPRRRRERLAASARLASSRGSAGSSTRRRAAASRPSSSATVCSSGRAAMRAASRSSFAVSGSSGAPVVGISGGPPSTRRSSAGPASGRISSATARAPGNRLAAASSARRPRRTIAPTAPWTRAAAASVGSPADEGGGVELDHHRDVEARRGRVEGDPHLAHRAHPHAADQHRRPRLEAADGVAEPHQERHAVRDAAAGAPSGGCLAQPERLLAHVQQIACALRQLDRRLGRGAGRRRPGEAEAKEQDGAAASDRRGWVPGACGQRDCSPMGRIFAGATDAAPRRRPGQAAARSGAMSGCDQSQLAPRGGGVGSAWPRLTIRAAECSLPARSMREDRHRCGKLQWLRSRSSGHLWPPTPRMRPYQARAPPRHLVRGHRAEAAVNKNIVGLKFAVDNKSAEQTSLRISASATTTIASPTSS